MVGSLHDSDHENLVRTFVGPSCRLGGFYLLILARGNRTPGSRDATGCNSLVAQATYALSSFQLTHMTREDQVRSIESVMASKGTTRTYYSSHNFASTVSFGM